MLRTLPEWKTFIYEHGASEEIVFDILRDWEESLSVIHRHVVGINAILKDKGHFLAVFEDHTCEYMENGHCKICGESYNGH